MIHFAIKQKLKIASYKAHYVIIFRLKLVVIHKSGFQNQADMYIATLLGNVDHNVRCNGNAFNSVRANQLHICKNIRLWSFLRTSSDSLNWESMGLKQLMQVHLFSCLQFPFMFRSLLTPFSLFLPDLLMNHSNFYRQLFIRIK